MPATTSAASKSKSEENGKPRYVKCDLTVGQREDLRRWREDGAELADLLKWVDERLAAGHSLSVKTQDYGYMASLTGVREASGHVGISLTARGRTATNAMFALQYKDQLILKGVWEVVDWSAELDL